MLDYSHLSIGRKLESLGEGVGRGWRGGREGAGVTRSLNCRSCAQRMKIRRR